MNKALKTFFRIINPLYLIGAMITTLGLEQLIVYGYQTMVVYSVWVVNAWALPYTIFAYGMIFLILVYKFKADSVYIFTIIYVIWDINALAGFLMWYSINPFYLLLGITSLPAFYMTIKKYRMSINWKMFIVYFIVMPIFSFYSIRVFQFNFLDFTWESINAILFSLIFVFGLKVREPK